MRSAVSSVQYCSVSSSIEIDNRIESAVSSSADDTRLSGAVTMLEGRDATQRDLDKLEKCVSVNFTWFSKARCKVLYVCWGSLHCQYRLGDDRVENSPMEKNLGGTGG